MSCLGSPQRPAWILIPLSICLISAAATGQIAPSAPSLNFGNVQVGSSLILPYRVNNTSKVNVTISQATVSGPGFSFAGPNLPITLAPRQAANLSISFSPQVGGTVSGTLTISASATWGGHGNVHYSNATVTLSGTGCTAGYLTAPPSMNLGSVIVGSSQTQVLTLSNSGGSSLTISAATVSGPAFSVAGMTFPYTLSAGGSANLSVTFAPTATGTNTVNLSISSNASNPSVIVALSGTGTTSSGTMGVTPGSLNFGSVSVGTTQTQNGSITASGGSVTVSSASSSNSQFTLAGLTLPVTIASGQSVPFSVSFTPTSTGSASANISFFTSTSASATQTVTGTGASVQHTVSLSWNASTSPSTTGYNVYRGNSRGGPYSRINSALNTSMNYSDSAVQAGQTYYYVTTAIDSTGVESTYSNEVQAAVPVP